MREFHVMICTFRHIRMLDQEKHHQYKLCDSLSIIVGRLSLGYGGIDGF